MKKTFILALFAVLQFGILSAQDLMIKGVIVSSSTQEPVEYTSIVLQTIDSSFVKGAASKIDGSFMITEVIPGDYRLVISRIGYHTLHEELIGLNSSVDLGQLMMEESSTELSDVIISGDAMIRKADRRIYFPSETQVKASSDGVNLLQQLMIPRIVINPVNTSISAADGETVKLRINDVSATYQDVIALRPHEIVRIDYIDNPGMRYGADTKYVINYIVRKETAGGSLDVNLMMSPNRWPYANNQISGKLNKDKSEFSLNYYNGLRNFDDQFRDNVEIFRFADGTERTRIEEGVPGAFDQVLHNLSAGYNFSEQDKYMFNAMLRYSGNITETKYNSNTYWQDLMERSIYMTDHNKWDVKIPSLDLYYQHNLKNNQSLIFNIVTTYVETANRWVYQEQLNDLFLTDIASNVIGKRYSFIGEAIYEKQLWDGKLSTGLKHTQGHTTNRYTWSTDSEKRTEMNETDTYLFGEYSGSLDKLDYTLGLGLSRFAVDQRNEDKAQNIFFRPRLRLRYGITPASSLFFETSFYNEAPSLAELSNVRQPIDSIQVRLGNPDLRPWLTMYNEISFDYAKEQWNANLKLSYRRMNKPVMDETQREEDLFIRTYDNQKYWSNLGGEFSLDTQLLNNHFMASLYGGYFNFRSVGDHYNHRYHDFFYTVQLMGNYNRVSLIFQYLRGRKWLQGETITQQEVAHLLSLNYNHSKYRVGVGMVNPFTDEYKRYDAILSEIASRKGHWYINDSPKTIFVTFSYNFSWGRRYEAGRKQLNNQDENSGILSGGK